MATSELNNPLNVSTDGTAGPYVMVTPEQLRYVVVAFSEVGIPFHVDDDAVRLDGIPALAVIDLGSEADVNQVQQVLDRVTTDLKGKERRGRRSPTRKELVVRGPLDAIQKMALRLDVDHLGDWSRQREIEARFKKSLPPGTYGFCFSKLVPAVGRRAAILFRAWGPVHPNELFASAVVPLGGGEAFSLKDHDEVIDDVRSTLIEPATDGLSVRILAYKTHVGPDLEDFLPPDALVRLWAFSKTANKASLHELDLIRWAEFIKQAHMDGALIDLQLLATWLDEQGFQIEQRNKLIQDYESARRVLRVYDEERQ